MFQREELSLVQTLRQERNFSIIIPFVCSHCGRCCRELLIFPEWADMRAIAKFLGLTLRQFINRYFGQVVKAQGVVRVHYSKPWEPCPFISSANTCTIYPARPRACRLFPLYTDLKDLGIGCPGYRQVMRVVEAIGQGMSYTLGSERIGESPSCSQWPETYQRFLTAKPSEKMIEGFLRANCIPEEALPLSTP